MFSKRMGLVNEKTIQLDDIDIELKNCLWNRLQNCFGDIFHKEDREKIFEYIQDFFLKSVVRNNYDIEDFKKWFFNTDYNKIYDFIEFFIKLDKIHRCFDVDKFITDCNIILEMECSGYRILGEQVTPIIDDIEIESIECSLHKTQYKFRGSNEHLKRAIELISDRKSPDYRNLIKESISAIESICTVISGNKKDSLAGALDKIKKPLKIHNSLISGFKSLYGYTSDEQGIRHKISDESTIYKEDAIYMLVQCSCFINYLIQKNDKISK